ncbi:hypothetical protein BT69DRAFT_1319371 [Atractiella rhizophila]|nr:hypothetical protein BT69DRAFT_1319371 [Atractiella rhizophila]
MPGWRKVSMSEKGKEIEGCPQDSERDDGGRWCWDSALKMSPGTPPARYLVWKERSRPRPAEATRKEKSFPSRLSSFRLLAQKALLRSHIRPVECLAYRFKPESQSACQLFSADSLGMLKAWSVSVSRVNGSDPVVKIVEDCEVKLHEIGIYDLRVWEDHIWTCSADNSALLSLFFPSTPSQPPVPIIRIKHPYYVKSLAFYPPLEEVNEDSFPSYLVTGSTDETIRIWDISSGPDDGDSFETVVEKKREELKKAILRQGTHPLPKETNWTLAPLAKVEGHWDEVSGLDIANLTVQGTLQTYLISSSLDCTVRTWDWLEVLRGSFTGEMVLEEKVEERGDENELLDELQHTVQQSSFTLDAWAGSIRLEVLVIAELLEPVSEREPAAEACFDLQWHFKHEVPPKFQVVDSGTSKLQYETG